MQTHQGRWHPLFRTWASIVHRTHPKRQPTARAYTPSAPYTSCCSAGRRWGRVCCRYRSTAATSPPPPTPPPTPPLTNVRPPPKTKPQTKTQNRRRHHRLPGLQRSRQAPARRWDRPQGAPRRLAARAARRRGKPRADGRCGSRGVLAAARAGRGARWACGLAFSRRSVVGVEGRRRRRRR